MKLSDDQLELLELFLDGELTGDESAALGARFESEPALVDALARLTADRESRRRLWASIEPSEAVAARLAKSIRAQAHSTLAREQVWSDRTRTFRRAGTLAACLLLAFFAGRIGRMSPGDSGTPLITARESGGPDASTRIVSNATVHAPSPEVGRLVFDPNPINMLRVPRLVKPDESQAYLVRLSDASGQTVGVQRFESLEEAQRFADNVRRLQQEFRQRRDAQDRDTQDRDTLRNNTVLIKEEF